MKSRCKPKPNENGGYERNGQSAKSALNRAISEAAWGELVKKVEVVAEKSGIPYVEEGVRRQQFWRQNQLDGDSKPQPIVDTVQTVGIYTR